MYKYILFDLDGTLTESAPGIIGSIKYAYQHYGIENYDEKELKKFVGPPLIESFMRYAGFDREKAKEAVEIYREYFCERGMFENSVYPGVRQCLERLRASGYILGVATSKPEPFCIRILDHFDLSKYFSKIKGIPLDKEEMSKSEVIAAVLSDFGVLDKSEVVMIGDRDYDVNGARENGIDCFGVLYGYGSAEELTSAGAARLFKTAEELCDFFITN